MVSTSGAELLPGEAIKSLIQHLLPLTTVLTPNIPEANLLLRAAGAQTCHDGDGDIRSVVDVEAIGRQIQALGPTWVLVKGGHLPFAMDMTVAGPSAGEKVVVDTLVGPGGQVLRIQSPWQESTNTHGTGCSLAGRLADLGGVWSSFLTACLAQPPYRLAWPRERLFPARSGLPVDMSRRASARRPSSAAVTVP